MTRRDIFCAASAALVTKAGIAAPQDEPNSQISFRNYSRCLPDALRSLASSAFEMRQAQLAAVTTPASIRARQHWARQTFWSLIGGKRERKPPQVRLTGQVRRSRYTVDKLLYESRPGEWISANLYVPATAASRFPAVLFQAGHSKNGKAGITYQCCCQGLAQLGFVVLSFDPIGQGERTNYPGANGLTRFASADDEHTVPGRQLILVGETMTRLQVEDALTSLDVLASHPRVHPHSIAAAGQSGGATLTMMLAAVDDRIAAAIVSCGNTENVACPNFGPPGSVDDAEQNLLNSGTVGFDRWDLLWPFAPRPLLVTVSANDFQDVYSPNYLNSGRAEFHRLAAAYSNLGFADQIRWYESPLPHALSPALRLQLYQWTAKWLRPEDPPVLSEPPVAPEEDGVLWATASGSVAHDLRSLTAFDLARKAAASIKTPSHLPDLRQLLALPPPSPHYAQWNVLSKVAFPKHQVTVAEVQTGPGVWVPLWIFAPLHQQSRKTLLILDPKGRKAHWQEGDLYQQLAEEAVVCVPDLRGFGTLAPEFSGGAPGYASDHQAEEAYAWASLVFGQPLLGQRVADLLTVIEALRHHLGGQSLGLLAAQGSLTIPALCAAALDNSVAALYLSGHLISWRSIIHQPDYAVPFADFLPNVLAQTDLPHIAASLAPSTLHLAGCVDAALTPLSENQIRQLYSGSHIQLHKPSWTKETFLSLLV